MPARVLVFLAAVIAALALVPTGASAAERSARYYLALGDSLSQGVQPGVGGLSLETNQGYADQLFEIERQHVPTLRLVKLGCPGDTTTSMLTGHGNDLAAKFFDCDRAGGSQLKAAELFLRAHHEPGEVPLVTIDIGANDVDPCAIAANVGQCVGAGEASIKRNLPRILRGIERAAPPGTVLAGMTLYNPVLARYFSASPAAKALASASVPFQKAINALITTADRAAGFRTADVAGAFKSYDTTDRVSFAGQLIPVNVARVCSWTWACTTPPSGPNIHANKNGYAVIAHAFASVVGRVPSGPAQNPPSFGLGARDTSSGLG